MHQHKKYEEMKRICMMEELSFRKLVPVIIFRAVSKDLLWAHSVLLNSANSIERYGSEKELIQQFKR
mgnify:CR=1 FL=1